MPLRLVIGSLLVYHGAPKLFSRRGHENIVHMIDEMGMPGAKVIAWPLGMVEFFGGLALVAGVGIRPVAATISVLSLGNVAQAIRLGEMPKPLPGMQPLPDVESSLLIAAGGATLALRAR